MKKKPSSLLIVPISLSLSLSASRSNIQHRDTFPDSLFFLLVSSRSPPSPPRTKTQLDGDGLSIKYARVTGGIDREIGPIVLNYEGSTDRDVEPRRGSL